MKELIDELRELAGVQCWASDHLANAAAALESQAREIERLDRESQNLSNQLGACGRELASLKAELGAKNGK